VTPRTFWAAESRKSGVAPAQSGVFFCVTFLILVSFISSFSRDLRASQGEEDGEDEVEVGNSYLLHLLRSNSHRAHRKNFLLGWSDPRLTLGTEPCAKVGSLQPTPVFARVQNQRTRETQPQCSLQCPLTEKMNGTVNRNVNRVFHAPFTFPRQKRPLNLIRIFAPLPLQRPQKRKM
jgi:hypothetical protein